MNKQYNFTLTGGFPLDQGVLNDEQNGILLVETAVANLLGPLAIISGCVVAGGSAANGVVAINGQILPFVGGAVAAKVIIVETDTDLAYFDGTPRAASITRYATFGDDGIQNNPWANFVTNNSPGVLGRLNEIETYYWQTGDVKEVDCTVEYIADNFDETGLGTNARIGWAICNGANGTRSRLGRVAVQYDAEQVEFNTMGYGGGAKAYVIEATDLPELQTDAFFGNTPGTSLSKVIAGANDANTQTGVGVNTGSPNNAISLLQDYIVTLMIQKL